jgi:putative transcriptional regulator
MAIIRISESIRRLRISRGFTQAELARRADISRQAVAAIEGGTYLPNVNVALKLARAFGATVEEIFGDEDENTQRRVQARWMQSPSIATDRELARIDR